MDNEPIIPLNDGLLIQDSVYDEIEFNNGVQKAIIRRKAGDVPDDAWQSWLGLPEWTPEQAVCLFFGINPFDYCNIESYQQIKLLLLHPEFKHNMSPYQWQQLGIEKKLPLPRHLRDIQKPVEEPQAEAVTNNDAGSQADKKTPTLLKEQQDNILKAIKALKLEPMAIPEGKKKVIQQYCENEYAESFKGSTSFDRAWNKGRKELWKMKRHDSYSRRGNN